MSLFLKFSIKISWGLFWHGSFPQHFSEFLVFFWIFGVFFRDFPRIDFGYNPPKNSTLLDFYNQPLKRVPVVWFLRALRGLIKNPPFPPFFKFCVIFWILPKKAESRIPLFQAMLPTNDVWIINGKKKYLGTLRFVFRPLGVVPASREWAH